MLNATKKSLVFVLFEKPFVIFGAFGNIYTQLKKKHAQCKQKTVCQRKGKGGQCGHKNAENTVNLSFQDCLLFSF